MTSSLPPNTKKRNPFVDILRFYFICMICLWHLGYAKVIPHGYLGVDFFFMLSGYYLFKHYKYKDEDEIKLIKNKIKTFYLPYIIVFIILFLFKIKHAIIVNDDIFRLFLRAFPECLLLHKIGFVDSNINFTSCFLSVLVIDTFFVYAILRRCHNCIFILPIIVILSYTYTFNCSDDIQMFEVDTFFPLSHLRGLAGLSLGVLIAKLQQYGFTMKKYANVVMLFSIVITTKLLWTSVYYDKYFLFFVIFLILSSTDNYHNHVKITNLIMRVSTHLGKISLYVYLIHPIILLCHIDRFLGDLNQCLINVVFLLIVYISANMLQIGCEKMQLYINVRKLNDKTAR